MIRYGSSDELKINNYDLKTSMLIGDAKKVLQD